MLYNEMARTTIHRLRTWNYTFCEQFLILVVLVQLVLIVSSARTLAFASCSSIQPHRTVSAFSSPFLLLLFCVFDWCQVTKLADALEERTFMRDEYIIRQGAYS